MAFVAISSSTTTHSYQFFFYLYALPSLIHYHITALVTGETTAFTNRHFVVIVISSYLHILLSIVIAALPNANRLNISTLGVPTSIADGTESACMKSERIF